MKKYLLLTALLALIAPLQARKKAPAMDIIEDRGFRSDRYSRLIVGKVSAAEFEKSIQDIKNFDAVADQIDDINLMLKAQLQQYAQREFVPGKGGKTLKVTAVMTDFNAGSTAAAMWVGAGAMASAAMRSTFGTATRTWPALKPPSASPASSTAAGAPRISPARRAAARSPN